MEENSIINNVVGVDNISLNYSEIQTTNILLCDLIILHISIFIFVFLKKCFDFKG